MLYKILDMLTQATIPFVFIGTSQKVDIIDAFEKRNRSRFSGKQILFYLDNFESYIEMLKAHLDHYE